LVLSWLPIHHSYAFNADLLKSMIARVPVRRIPSPRKIIAAIRRFRPTHLHAVPRLYEKLHRLALAGHSLKALTGGRLRWAGCGGAPLPGWLSDFFQTHGMPLLEGYGLTEASPLVSLNTPAHHRAGTAGRIIPGTTVRFADNNEILVKGPGVMAGYWNDTAATQAAIHDGWLHTGDLGRLDAEGYLTIDGRTRELVVLSTGRKVPPLPAEAAAMALPYIDRAILCGHNQPRPAMLVWLAKGDDCTNIENSVMAAMSTIEAHLRPARVIVADRPLSAERGELTSLGKLRRDTIEANWWQFVSNSMQQC
jgi:long-chain acyl-CoA synthetase